MIRYRASFSRIARVVVLAILALVTVGFFAAKTAFAHCDGLDGPVVIAAQKALQTGDLNPVLI